MLVEKKINAKLSAYIVLILFIIMIIVPLFFFTQKLVVETKSLTQYISSSDISFDSIVSNLKKWPILNDIIPDPDSLTSEIGSGLKYAVSATSEFILGLASQIPSLLIDILFVLLSLLVFLLNGEKIKIYITNLIPLHEYIKNGLLVSSNEISKMAFLASFLTAMGQAITILIGFLILGVPNAFLAHGATFILSFIPFIGPTPVWVAGAIYLIIEDSIFKAVVMVLFGMISSVIDNIIRALVLKGTKGQLHPFIGFISIIGGINVFGLLGVLIGPIVAALLLSMCNLWPSVLEKNNKPVLKTDKSQQ